MELFVIHCTTCRARLKVHDPAVIGQIVECPKCRSFVAVTAPPDWQSPAKSPSAGAAVAGASHPLAASGASGAAVDRPANAGLKSTAAGAAAANLPVARHATPPPLPKKSGSSASGMSSSSFIKSVPRSAASSTGRAAAVGAWAPTVNQPATAAATSATEPAAEVVGANPSAADAAPTLFGQYRWWIVGGAVAIASVASMAWVFSRSHAATPMPDQPPVVERAADPTPADNLAKGAADNVGQEPTDKVEHDRATSNPTPIAPATAPAVAASATDDERINAKDAAEPAPQASPAPSPKLSASGGKSAPGAMAADADPLVPETYGTAGGKLPEPSAQSAGRATTGLEDGSNEAEAFDPIKQARLMSHLQDKLSAFEFTSVPLGQFVAFLSEFSTVPMVIDTQSLAEAGKSAEARISVKMDDATVEEALRAALDKPGMAFHIEPGRLIITPRAAKSK